MFALLCCMLLLLSNATGFVSHKTSKMFGISIRKNSIRYGFKPGWDKPVEGYNMNPETNVSFTEKEFVPNAPKKFTISTLTLAEISVRYGFSLNFLGDFVVQKGAKIPVDADIPVEMYLDGDQLYHLLTTITTYHPSDANQPYSLSYSLRQLSHEFKISVPQMIRLCDRCNVNLPFGMNTVPHKSDMATLKRMFEYDTAPVDSKITVGGITMDSTATEETTKDRSKLYEEDTNESYFDKMVKLGQGVGGFDEKGFYKKFGEERYDPRGDALGGGVLPSAIADD